MHPLRSPLLATTPAAAQPLAAVDGSFWDRRLRALRHVAPYAGLVLLPAIFWAFAFKIAIEQDLLATDFHLFFYAHGQDVLAGRTPPGAYPALTSLLLAPFALLPHRVADVTFTLVLVACAAGTLWALDVRDWRCYGAAALWYPVFNGVQSGNVSLLLALGVALLWRWRDRPLTAGIVASLLVALKLFLWPLLIWLAVTRRWKALAVSAVVGGAASLAAWSVIGFGTLAKFPGFLHSMVQTEGRRSYAIAGFLQDLGSPHALAYATSIGLGVGLLALVVAFRRRPAAALSLALGATFVVSPILWPHYLTALLVVVAIARPRFSWLWLAPLPLWLCPPVEGVVWQKALLLGVVAAIVVHLVRSSTERTAPAVSS